MRFVYVWLLLPIVIPAVLLFVLHIISKDTFLRLMELFVVLIPNKKKQAKRFWDRNQKHLKQWYLSAKKDDDLIISASPDFLIGEICSRLQVKYICTETRPCGLPKEKHCYGEIKVVEYKKRYGDLPLETFYSDSMSDEPMFKLAQSGYYVRGDKITLIYQNGEKLPTAQKH